MMTIVNKTHAQKLSSLIKGCQNNILPGYSLNVRDCHDMDMMPGPVGVRLNYTRSMMNKGICTLNHPLRS